LVTVGRSRSVGHPPPPPPQPRALGRHPGRRPWPRHSLHRTLNVRRLANVLRVNGDDGRHTHARHAIEDEGVRRSRARASDAGDALATDERRAVSLIENRNDDE